MAENEQAEPTAEQESPSVENKQPNVESAESAEKPEQTPVAEAEGEVPETGDKNWRAAREKLEKLERENEELKAKAGVQEEPKVTSARDNPAVNPLLTQQDTISLQLNEMQALSKFPELDPDSDSYDELFDMTVSGEYRAELDRYAKGLYVGQRLPLPSAHKIAKKVKGKWDVKFAGTKAKVDEQKEKALEQKQATTEAEGRTDKRTPKGEDLDNLKHATRRGDYSATAERLSRSGL